MYHLHPQATFRILVLTLFQPSLNLRPQRAFASMSPHSLHQTSLPPTQSQTEAPSTARYPTSTHPSHYYQHPPSRRIFHSAPLSKATDISHHYAHRNKPGNRKSGRAASASTHEIPFYTAASSSLNTGSKLSTCVASRQPSCSKFPP
jgi:hypothetical protein